jgi:hypothetical protein
MLLGRVRQKVGGDYQEVIGLFGLDPCERRAYFFNRYSLLPMLTLHEPPLDERYTRRLVKPFTFDVSSLIGCTGVESRPLAP